MKRAAVLRDPAILPASPCSAPSGATAQSLGVEVSPIGMHNAGEIERGVVAFARSTIGGLIVAPNAAVSVHRDLIVTLAGRYKLPAVYPFRYMATGGGLVSYGPDLVDQFRLAAGYVIRSSRVKSLPIFPFRRQPNTSW